MGRAELLLKGRRFEACRNSEKRKWSQLDVAGSVARKSAGIVILERTADASGL